MKVEVDMEKISAEIAAAEEAARKRMAEREKDAGDRSARDAPTCVLAEEEKHICATHGSKSQQTPLSDSNSKQCDNTESHSADMAGEPGLGLLFSCFLRMPFDVWPSGFFYSGKIKSSEELEVHPGSEEGASEDKESVPEGVLEEGTSDSNTGSETTSAQTEDTSANEPPCNEGPCKARVAHWDQGLPAGLQNHPWRTRISQNHLSVWKHV